MANELYAALERFGFESEGTVCFGTWKGYAISLRQLTAKTYYVDAAVRLSKVPGGLRRRGSFGAQRHDPDGGRVYPLRRAVRDGHLFPKCDIQSGGGY